MGPVGDSMKTGDPVFSVLGTCVCFYIRVFPKIGGLNTQNGWFKMENPIKIHDLGGNTPIFGNNHIGDYNNKSMK